MERSRSPIQLHPGIRRLQRRRLQNFHLPRRLSAGVQDITVYNNYERRDPLRQRATQCSVPYHIDEIILIKGRLPAECDRYARCWAQEVFLRPHQGLQARRVGLPVYL